MRKENFKGGWFRQDEVEIKLIHFIWVDHFNEENGLSPCGILTIAYECWASIQSHPLPGTWLHGQLRGIIQYISQPKHHDYIWLPLSCRPTSFPYSLSFCLFPNEPSLLPYIRGELASRLPQWVSSTSAALQSKACWQGGAHHRKSLLLLPFVRSWSVPILAFSFMATVQLCSSLGHFLQFRGMKVVRLFLHCSSPTGYGAWQHSLELVYTSLSSQGDPRLRIPCRNPQGQNVLSHPWQLIPRLHHPHTNECWASQHYHFPSAWIAVHFSLYLRFLLQISLITLLAHIPQGQQFFNLSSVTL